MRHFHLLLNKYPITLSGWQSRWFILEDGILSYYKSYDEVSQGCKGSLNIAACEIVVSHQDHTRFDLIISGGEQVVVGSNPVQIARGHNVYDND